MKLRFALSVVLLAICINIYGQQKKSAPTQKQQIEELTATVSNQQEAISQLQAENKELLKQLGKMEHEIEIYREDVRNKIPELDAEHDRWTAWICSIVALLGVVFPIVLNNRNDKKMEKQIDTATEKAEQATASAKELEGKINNVSQQVDSATKQASEATKQANEAKKAVEVIQDLKQQVENIQKKISKNAKDAEDAAISAKASQLFTEAFNEKDKSTKIELYTQAIELKPDYYQAYNNRGVAKMETGDNDGALKDYNKVVELKPDYYKVYNNRGNVKKANGDYEEALADYNKAIELKPDYALCYNNRAKLFRDLAEIEPDNNKKAVYISKAEDDEKKAQSLKEEKNKKNP